MADTTIKRASQFVSYYRVSTQKQGRSGLGLAAQQEDIRRYVEAVGGEIIADFEEIESGKKADRPRLADALAVCRLSGATLIIAKLDRLARNVAFVSTLMESEVEFVAVDFPQANKLTIHILAAIAEYERELISKRTKAALSAAKQKGTKLGFQNPKKAEHAKAASEKGKLKRIRLSAESRRANSVKRATDCAAVIIEIIDNGQTSLRAIAAELTARPTIKAPRGGVWHVESVRRVLASADVNGRKLIDIWREARAVKRAISSTSRPYKPSKTAIAKFAGALEQIIVEGNIAMRDIVHELGARGLRAPGGTWSAEGVVQMVGVATKDNPHLTELWEHTEGTRRLLERAERRKLEHTNVGVGA